jgi:hypothetical protein
MRIQTFENGELIEERENEEFSAPPNILQFNTQMLFSQSYMKLANNAEDENAKTRLELSSVRLELKPKVTIQDLQVFQLIWNTLVASVPQGILVEADGENFNQIAESNNMPFRFGAEMKMEILAT